MTPVALKGMSSAIASLLQLPLVLADPTSHIPSLQAHVVALVQDPSIAQPPLPAALVTALSALVARIHEVGQSAMALADLVARTDLLTHLPTQPSACAFLLLALEAERRDSLPHAGVLAAVLGARIGKSKRVVMDRYKIVYDLIEEWIAEVPWLEGHEKKAGGRSKVAKRVVVAKGLKDVLQFREEIWKKKMSALERPVLALELDSQDDSTEDSSSEAHTSERGSETDEAAGPVRKKRRTAHEQTIADVSQFLLHPTSTTAASPSKSQSSNCELLSHLLTAEESSLPDVFTKAPTRLQLLAAERGGARDSDILDEELFVEGELEAMIRNDGEVTSLKAMMQWDAQPDSAQKTPTKARQRKMDQESDPGQGTKRIDFAALARVLGPSDDTIGEEGDDVTAYTFAFGEGGEVVEEWRPVSPEGRTFNEEWYEP